MMNLPFSSLLILLIPTAGVLIVAQEIVFNPEPTAMAGEQQGAVAVGSGLNEKTALRSLALSFPINGIDHHS
jgi:hypothetical protein